MCVLGGAEVGGEGWDGMVDAARLIAVVVCVDELENSWTS